MEQAKKEGILQAACRAFAQFGFKKASVDEIAREAGVAKGTVYLACDSKEDLFYQAVHREVRQLVAELSRIIDPRVRADELLQRLAFATVMYLDARPLVRDLLSGLCDGVMPSWADRFDELRELGHGHVVEVLRLGVKQGIFRKDLDIEETASLLQDLHVMNMQYRGRGKFSPEQLAKRSQAGFALILNGIVIPSAAPAGS